MRNGNSPAFTLIEALAAVVLVAVGITASVGTLGRLEKLDTRAIETEEMQRLSIRKFDEIVALASLPQGSASGDFLDIGEKRFVWQATRTSAGIGNLDSIRVQVARKGDSFVYGADIQGLICRPLVKGAAK